VRRGGQTAEIVEGDRFTLKTKASETLELHPE
jgi:hypothetical protein